MPPVAKKPSPKVAKKQTKKSSNKRSASKTKKGKSSNKRSPKPKARNLAVARKRSSKRSSPRSVARAVPKVKASTLMVGMKRKGQDGHMYRVEETKTGRHTWKKCAKGLCRFIGPMRRPRGFVSVKA